MNNKTKAGVVLGIAITLGAGALITPNLIQKNNLENTSKTPENSIAEDTNTSVEKINEAVVKNENNIEVAKETALSNNPILNTLTPPILTNDKPAEVEVITNKYKNGEFSENIKYDSPGGSEDLGVNIKIENDVVVSLSIIEGAHHPKSKQYQKAFIDGVEGKVVGKNLDEVSPSTISGASLTTNAFNLMIRQIKSDITL